MVWRRSSFQKSRTTLLAGSHSIIAARRPKNSCSTPWVGTKRMMTELRVLREPAAIGFGNKLSHRRLKVFAKTYRASITTISLSPNAHNVTFNAAQSGQSEHGKEWSIARGRRGVVRA